MEANNDGRRDTALHAKYLEKYMQREDLKSGMRRYLINELINGVEE